jgi:hypothetical protein
MVDRQSGLAAIERRHESQILANWLDLLAIGSSRCR